MVPLRKFLVEENSFDFSFNANNENDVEVSVATVGTTEQMTVTTKIEPSTTVVMTTFFVPDACTSQDDCEIIEDFCHDLSCDCLNGNCVIRDTTTTSTTTSTTTTTTTTTSTTTTSSTTSSQESFNLLLRNLKSKV